MHIDNYVIEVSNNVIVNRSNLGNSVSVHTYVPGLVMRPPDDPHLVSCLAGLLTAA